MQGASWMTLTEGNFFPNILSLYLLFYRIAAVPGFPGLRRFPEGRKFKQWTGNNSKALMKV